MLSDHASLLTWSMVNQIVIKYCLVSYFKGACHGNGLKYAVFLKKTSTLFIKVGIMGRMENRQKLDNM